MLKLNKCEKLLFYRWLPTGLCDAGVDKRHQGQRSCVKGRLHFYNLTCYNVTIHLLHDSLRDGFKKNPNCWKKKFTK